VFHKEQFFEVRKSDMAHKYLTPGHSNFILECLFFFLCRCRWVCMYVCKYVCMNVPLATGTIPPGAM